MHGPVITVFHPSKKYNRALWITVDRNNKFHVGIAMPYMDMPNLTRIFEKSPFFPKTVDKSLKTVDNCESMWITFHFQAFLIHRLQMLYPHIWGVFF